MTLCVAWIRKVGNIEELVFATDSCLSGGERWHSGVKLFELPRKDCLICFAGETTRTYPLILNLISSIKFDEHLSNPHTDITDVLDYLTALFSTLCNSITQYDPQTFEDALGDFEFMFGGWSWKANKFKVWTLKYNHGLKAFLPNQLDENNMIYGFIGDEIEKSNQLLEQELVSNKKVMSRVFDMEPFQVLLKMIRDTKYNYIDGAIQLAKIHPPGITEFLGVMWPSVKGKKTFLGKDVNFENNPAVRFLDPDTCEIIGESIPEKITEPLEDVYGINFDFVVDCYPPPNYKLKTGISERETHILKSIFKEIAYVQFIEKEQAENEQNQELEE